jgi:hypothetical protein
VSRSKILAMGATVMLVLVVSASALAAGKGAFTPKVGEYTGTLTAPVGSLPGLGAVEKSGGKLVFQLRSGPSAKCSDGTLYSLPLGIVAPIKGKSFKAEETVANPQSTYGSREVTIKVSGHFTAATKLTGTASATTTVEAGDPVSKECTTGNVKFTLKKK